MEEMSALIATMVQTKSIERVLSPIAAQVSQLIILNDAYERGDNDAFPADLVSSASVVMKSTEGLVEVAGRLADDSTNQNLKTQMPGACELLSVAGQNLVTASHRVHVEKFSADSRRHLVRTAKDVLEGTLKVLLVSDEAEIQKILKTSRWVMDRLAVLTAVKSMKQLVPAFKSFTEVIMLLSTLVEKRRLELVNSQYRDKLFTTMGTLKKCVPMLNTAMQTYVKYPSNAQAKAGDVLQSSKDYVVGQVMVCLEDVDSIIQNKYVDTDELDEVEEPGQFVTIIDKVLDSLSADRRLAVAQVGSEFDVILESAVRHSMAVAQLSSHKHHNLISKNCQRVLKQRNQVSELSKSVKDNPSFSELREDFNDSCERLVGEFQDLEQHINASILQLIVSTFYETTEPLERLVKAALTPEAVPGAGSVTSMQLYTDAFHAHSDRMCQVARFTAASHPHPKRVRVIRSCVSHLERLDPEILPACIACRDSPGDHGAVEHLRLLKKEWTSNVNLLLSNIDDIIDTRQLLEIADQEIRSAVSQCKDSLYSEGQAVADGTRAVIGQARRLSQLTSRLVDAHDDPLYRNGMMVYVTQLNKVIPAVKSSANRVIRDMGDLKQHESLHRRCDTLLKAVFKIREGLDGKGLPDLLHPARQNARTPQDPEKQEDQDLYFLDYEDNPERENIPVLQTAAAAATDSRKLAREQKDKENIALRKYIVDLTSSQLADLTRSLISAAVAGQQQKVDLLSNDVLSRCNLGVEVAKLLTKCVVEPSKKQTLQKAISELLALTPELLTKSRKVVECDTDQVEPLYTAADLWAGQLSYLESHVDGIVADWKVFSDQVVDAAKMCNNQLLTAEIKQLDSHKMFVRDIVSDADKLVDTSDLFAVERIHVLRGHADDFDNVTATLGTMADVLSKTGQSEDKVPLETTSREWATLVYHIMCTVSQMACEAVAQLSGHGVCVEKAETSLVQRELTSFTQDTIRLKGLVNATFEGCPTGDTEQRAQALLTELDLLTAHMQDCSKLLTHVTAPYLTTEKLYAPQNMCLLQWRWARKTQEVHALLDEVTAEFCLPLKAVLDNAVAMGAAATDSERDEAMVAYFRGLDHFNQQFMKCRASALDALQMSSDIDKKCEVRQLLEELSALAKEMTDTAKTLPDLKGNEGVKKLEAFKRQWAPNCYRLMALLEGLGDANKTAVLDVSRHLKTAPQVAASPKVFVSSSPVKSPIVTKATTSPSKAADAIAASSTKANSSSASFTRGQIQKSASTPSGQASELSPEQVTIGASLLDFADDLMATYDSIAHGVSPDSTLHSDSSSTFSPGGAAKSATPSVDQSWKQLAAGPKTQHSTPARPSENSGFKPGAHSKYVSSSGLFKFPLLDTLEQWEDGSNTIVRIAKDITRELGHMAQFTRGHGPIQNKEELINKAKSIAKNGEKLVHFAKILAKYCVDRNFARELQLHADHVPTVIAQLNVMASVKAATPDDITAEKMLIKTAENLVEALNKMLSAAEATCVKGFREPSPDALDDTEALVLATQWKRKYNNHRLIETSNAGVDNLGLKIVNRNTAAPALSQIMMQR